MSVDSRIGTELAGYRIEALLGRGGMSDVYLATHVQLKRKVALKLLAGSLADDEAFRERFLQESELAASIDHPNIVPIYEAGETDGLLFIAMRYVEGSDLRGRLRAGPLDSEDAAGILGQVAAALDAAHLRGLVHRDVKPSNVLLDPEGGRDGADHAYLADFGLTRRLSETPTPVDDAQRKLSGTVDYVAPEQIAGKSVDDRADVYSLGCVLYECLVGEPPFPHDSDVAVLFAHLEEPPPSPPEVRPELPAAVGPVVARALSKDPDDRQQTCAELVEEAREALGLAPPARSRWLSAPVLAAAIGLALVAAGLASYFAVRGEPGPRRDTLFRIDPATNEVLESFPVGAGASSVTVGDEGYLWVTSWNDRTLWRIDPETGESRVTAVNGGTPQDVVVSKGLAVVANGPYEISYERINAASGALIEMQPLVGAEGGPASVDMGDGGIWFAACGYEGGSVAQVRESLRRGDVFERAPVFPTDPDWLFFTTPDAGGYNDVAVGAGGVWLARDGGPVLKRLDPDTGDVVSTIDLPWTAKSLAAGQDALWLTAILDDVVARLDPVTNEITMTVPVGRGADGVALGDDGSVWVASSIDGTVSRIDPQTGEVVASIEVDGRPENVAVGAGGVWVTSHTA